MVAEAKGVQIKANLSERPLKNKNNNQKDTEAKDALL
jgi:hypothetical protein